MLIIPINFHHYVSETQIISNGYYDKEYKSEFINITLAKRFVFMTGFSRRFKNPIPLWGKNLEYFEQTYSKN